MEEYITGTRQKLSVHEKESCDGNCCIHNPSDHIMKDWPTHWRADRSLMERICDCGVGHPDPDDLAFKKKRGMDITYEGVHGCCGCCMKKSVDAIRKMHKSCMFRTVTGIKHEWIGGEVIDKNTTIATGTLIWEIRPFVEERHCKVFLGKVQEDGMVKTISSGHRFDSDEFYEFLGEIKGHLNKIVA